MSEYTPKQVIRRLKRGKCLAGANLTGIDLSGAKLGTKQYSFTTHYIKKPATLNRANLEGANLSDANFIEANFSKANLKNANLSWARLDKANLEGAILSKANLTNASLTNANLTNANLTNANLSDAKLADILGFSGVAKLIGANLENANLENACLKRAVLKETNFKNVNFSGADLSLVDLSELDLRNFDFSRADLGSANLMKTDLREANLNESDLSRSDLRDANLESSDLSGANLEETNVCNANFSNANLSKAHLKNTDLKKAKLVQVNFFATDLSGCNLKQINFTGANLQRANLSSADFENTDLTEADISGANIYHLKTHGWKIYGIKCTHAYQCPDDKSWNDPNEREKYRRDFAPGEFEEKFKGLHTLELIYKKGYTGLTHKVMLEVVNRINLEFPSVNLGFRKIEKDINFTATLTADTKEAVEKATNILNEQYAKVLVDLEKIKKLVTDHSYQLSLPEWYMQRRELYEKPTKEHLPDIIVSGNKSKEIILVGIVYLVAGFAGQIFRQKTEHDIGIDGEIEFLDNQGKSTGKMIYLQLKSGDSYLRQRKKDDKEIIYIDEKHIDYWQSLPCYVYLVIRTSDDNVRWMNVTDYLENRPDKESKQIIFDGEPFNTAALIRVRSKLVESSSKLISN